jgi:hypothetical protein
VALLSASSQIVEGDKGRGHRPRLIGEPSALLLFDAMSTQLKKSKVADADLAMAHVELPVCACS